MNLDIIKKCFEDYQYKLEHYDKINQYYYGNTDSLKNFRPANGRSNLKIYINFIQKLVDEEAQYSYGNTTTYTSKDDNAEAINAIEYILQNNKADHDINLGRELICFGQAFEISYIDRKGKFKNKKVSPLNGYMYVDENEDPEYFLHVFEKQLDNTKYIDVYTSNAIYHLNEKLEEVALPTEHYFGIVPVGYGLIGGKAYSENRGYVEGDKTIYRTIKTLQDALETNLGDIVSEISDFRNAILKMYGIELEDSIDTDGNVILGADGSPLKKTPVIRDNAILYFNDKSKEDAEWLTKNINDTFIKNTRDDLKELIYTLTSHIDSNEKMQSNTSGIALRSRLQALEAKCKDNEKAMINILQTRLQCLFKYLFLTQSKTYNANMISILFTPNIPIDEQSLADVISKIPHEVVSNYTKRSWLPKINNADLEGERIKKEIDAEMPAIDLNNVGA